MLCGWRARCPPLRRMSLDRCRGGSVTITKILALVGALSLLCCTPLRAQLVPATPTAIVPEQLVWAPYSAGGVQAILLGDPSRPGTYVVRIRPPAGLHIAPHSHPDGRIVQVLSGTIYLAFGEQADTSRMRAFPAGSLFTEPAGAVHYSWMKDGEVVLQIVGTGPSGSRPAPARQ